VVTLHVPLTRMGRCPTFHMAEAGFFRKLKAGCVFINAARGPVAVSDDLIAALGSGQVAHAVLDTWEGEPRIRADVMACAGIGTPHIAGYSYDGKVAGTVMVYREVCRFLGVPAAWTPDAAMPAPPVPEVCVDAAGRDREDVLWDVVRQVYDIEADDRRLRDTMSLPAAERGEALRSCAAAIRNGGSSALRGS